LIENAKNLLEDFLAHGLKGSSQHFSELKGNVEFQQEPKQIQKK
jgi:hypothetical protein